MFRDWQAWLSVVLLPAALGGRRAMKGAMPRTNLWNHSMPRAELDQRSREARLRLERIERQPFPCTVATRSRLRRFLMAVSRESAGSGPAERPPPVKPRARAIAKPGQFGRAAADDQRR